MNAFRFRLEKVLDWRRTELEMEEGKYKRERAAISELDRQRAEWEASGIRAEFEVRKWSEVSGADLAALGNFRKQVKIKEAEIAQKRAERLRALAQREAAMMEARRRCRLLERLKERRRSEWSKLADRELEELASESFLARWNREAERQ